MKITILLNLPVIGTQNGGYFFSVFYLLGFLLAIAVFLTGSARNKIPLRTTLLVTATCVLFFILGDKFFAIEPSSWKNIFTDPESISHKGKTVLGGITGLCIAVFIAGKWLGLKNSLPDRFSIALPLGMAFARLGCLMSGCCYGSPSTLPWAIQYGPHSHAFLSQLQNGLISPFAACSLPVHPVPVYEMLGCLAIALAVWLSRRYWKAPGSQLLFMVLLYGIVRFILEFFRDPAGNKFAGTEFWGIKYVQWIVLAGIMATGMILWLRERSKKRAASLQPADLRTGDFSYVSLTVFILLAYMTVFSWLTPLERFTAGMALLPALGISWWTVFRRMTVPSLRMVTFLLPLSGLIFMSQTYVPDSTGNKIRYREMNFGAIYNSLHVYPLYAYSEDCGGFSTRQAENRNDEFYMVGGGYSVNDIIGIHNRSAFGINGFVGYKNESYTKTNSGNIQIGITPYYSHDWHWFGLKGGVILGYYNIDGVYKYLNKHSSVGDYSDLLRNLYAFPQASVRVGPMEYFYFDIRLADQLPGRSPYTLLQIGVGTGLGKFNGTSLRLGVVPVLNGNTNNISPPYGYYAQMVYPIKEKYVVDLYLGSNFATGDAAKNCISIGFQYRYGYTTVARKLKEKKEKKVSASRGMFPPFHKPKTGDTATIK